MTIIIKTKTGITLGASMILALGLTACGDGNVSSQTGAADASEGVAEGGRSTTSESHSQDGSAQESEEAVPRLVISHEAGVEVFDVTPSGVTSVTGIDTKTRPRLVAAPDERHLFLVESDENKTQVLDAGSYSQAHGDHFHHYLRKPELRPDVIEGDTPIHVVNHGGRTAIFNDGDGSIDLFDVSDITAGGLTVETVEASSAHHGVAVPLPEGALVSQSAAGEALPESLVQLDGAGATVNEWKQACPGLHGEAVAAPVIAFGCLDGVLLMEGAEDTLLNYPEDDGEARIGSLYAAEDSDVLIGNYDDTRIASVNVAAQDFSTIDVEESYGAIARGFGGQALVLGTDGVLRGFDPADGEALGEVQALEAFELPEGHGSPTPSLAVVGDTAYLTDPADEILVTIDTDDRTLESRTDLGVSPTQVVAVNAAHRP